jgi:hypothetical protein
MCARDLAARMRLERARMGTPGCARASNTLSPGTPSHPHASAAPRAAPKVLGRAGSTLVPACFHSSAPAAVLAALHPASLSTHPPSPHRRTTSSRPATPPQKKRVQGVPAESYLQRWFNNLPRKDMNSWLSGVCSGCECPGSSRNALVPCAGPCQRSFHLS